VIFEIMNLKERHKISTKEAYELGKYIGRLHKLTKNFSMHRRGQDFRSFESLLRKNEWRIKKSPQRAKRVIGFIREIHSSFKIPSNQPKAVCHIEFTPEHVRFKKQKLIKVIDWDEVCRDFMINDLGTTMVAGLKNGKINFSVLKAILKGYESQRKMTSWEKEHLFEAISFGISKFVIWGLDEDMTWNRSSVRSTEALMRLGKDRFNESLEL